jgi:hypothetical protein
MSPPKEEKVKQNRFPPGWDEERVRRVLAHYEEQTEVEAVAEDEAVLDDRTQTITDATGSPPRPAGSRH